MFANVFDVVIGKITQFQQESTKKKEGKIEILLQQ
jgi:hypothetical protein